MEFNMSFQDARACFVLIGFLPAFPPPPSSSPGPFSPPPSHHLQLLASIGEKTQCSVWVWVILPNIITLGLFHFFPTNDSISLFFIAK